MFSLYVIEPPTSGGVGNDRTLTPKPVRSIAIHLDASLQIDTPLRCVLKLRAQTAAFIRILLIHWRRMVNAFGYWQGKDITDATATYLDDLQQAIGHIQRIVGVDTIEIWNGETGWPGDGV